MTQLTLAKPDHAETLIKLIGDFHAEEGLESTEDHRAAAISPLLEGSPNGAIYLAGPARAPVGYVALSFGWSITGGGLETYIDEFYIRPGVRGRGIGTEILTNLPAQLASFGLKALHLDVHHTNTRARKLYEKLGFNANEDYTLMTRRL
ncbi:MAG: GNAT family N-acetyltransferase [Pseudomonadota bacterium]